jgi:hypothetical protein
MQDELGISVLSYSIFISSYAFFVLNLMNSVLEKFRKSKLVLNHNFNLLRTLVTLLKNNIGSGFDVIRLVSSAKKIREEILVNTRGSVCIFVKNDQHFNKIDISHHYKEQDLGNLCSSSSN